MSSPLVEQPSAELWSPRIGAVDCGSNAIRAAIADVDHPAGQPTRAVRRRLPVRLGTDAFRTGRIGAETAVHFAAAMSEIAEWFAAEGVHRHRAVATSAVRNADNRDELCRAASRAGIALSPISGAAEASLVRRAVLATGARPTLIADLGGGSLELQILRGHRRVAGAVLPVGTVRLGAEHGALGAISPGHRRSMAGAVAAELARLPRPSGEVVLCGGNAKALAKLYPAPADRSRRVDLRRLDAELSELCALSTRERMAAYRVRQDRADVIGAAAIVFAEVARWSGASIAAVPGVGVLDGLLLAQQDEIRAGDAIAARSQRPDAPALEPC